jgi:hypothetical protein
LFLLPTRLARAIEASAAECMWPVCFIKHLDKLADEFLKAPAPRKWRDALQNYSDGVLADTTTWISLGIKDYYLSIPKDVLRGV